VDTETVIATAAEKNANWPKSSGEYNRLSSGVTQQYYTLSYDVGAQDVDGISAKSRPPAG
jgi:hypothetical protein